MNLSLKAVILEFNSSEPQFDKQSIENHMAKSKNDVCVYEIIKVNSQIMNLVNTDDNETYLMNKTD